MGKERESTADHLGFYIHQEAQLQRQDLPGQMRPEPMTFANILPKLGRSIQMVVSALPNLLKQDGSPEILSLDLFDTLLQRPPAAEAIWLRRWAEDVGSMMQIDSDRLFTARQHAKTVSITTSGSGRPDPVPTHRELLARTLRLVGNGTEAEGNLLMRMEEIELAAITQVTQPDPAAVELVHRAREAGLRLLITSDMYLSVASLSQLLERHGLQGFTRIYVSSEEGRTKFSGRLFDQLLQQEGVPASKVLHVGDHPWSDGIAPASRGIRTRWIGPPSAPARLRQRAITSPLPGEAPGWRLGNRILAPALAPALPLLQKHIAQLEPDLVLYIARDGELLQRLMEAIGYQVPAPVKYALLSRRSTLTPSLKQLDIGQACELLSQRRQNRGLSTLFGSLGIDAKSFIATFRTAGFTRFDEPIPKPSQDIRLMRLLKDPDFQDKFRQEVTRQRKLLRHYLDALGYFKARKVVLIDLGWRGSIQDSLAAAFADDPTAPELHGVYLGLWDDGLVGNARSLTNKVGLLADPRRGRYLLEAALPELGLALEPVFRARHGTVTGYRQVGNRVEAVLDDDLHRRAHEQRGETHSDTIREGLIEGCRLRATTQSMPTGSVFSRMLAQLRLMRLAYAPTKHEINLLGRLPISEGAEPQWSLPAIISQPQTNTQKPFGGARQWATGLESPWRAGYIAATAGFPGVMGYMLIQMLWLPMPAIVKRMARQRALHLVYFAADAENKPSHHPSSTRQTHQSSKHPRLRRDA